ncbi:MAG: DNA-protecting protein DprA [Deltaproteobacteria bacterium]|nr:DNA-protecting protein DprA [Deltaproteobacteria bacterium]
METRGRDPEARWACFLEGLEGAARVLAERAAALQVPAVHPRRWDSALRVARDALEHLGSLGAWVRVPGGEGWPPALLRCPDPPRMLTGRGELPAGPCLALVGTRDADAEGEALTRRLATAWVEAGGWVVSGGARGIDTAAHLGALAAGGSTVAVTGAGLGKPYPRGNRGLFERIARAGAVVSEYPPGLGAQAWTFLRRNRLVAAFAQAVVVVQAPPRSGALHTARFALKCGWKVLTVPGKPGDPRHAGARSLLVEGAQALRGPGDLAAVWDRVPTPEGAPEPAPQESPDVRRVREALVEGVLHGDEIARRTALAPGALSAVLLELELQGLVVALPGGLYRGTPGLR